MEGILTDYLVSRLRRHGRLASVKGGRTMNLRERAACDGLDDSSIAETMAWLKDACERLEWEIYSATNELHTQSSKLTKLKAAAEEVQ